MQMHSKVTGVVLKVRPENNIPVELGMDETEANLPVGLRCYNHWKNLATIPLQALPLILKALRCMYPLLDVETSTKIGLALVHS